MIDSTLRCRKTEKRRKNITWGQVNEQHLIYRTLRKMTLGIGLALVFSAVLIVIYAPSDLMIFTVPYTGSQTTLSIILVMLGLLATRLGKSMNKN
ncbi:MAG: hypothetical protein NWE89_02830 [Candidatus Bathyarchaeota archaeon]|nr:hypothetical protein [Candidatus Bathyarchaeota archaeon]